MLYNLDKKLEQEIISLAEKHGIKKLILFGSRAKKINHDRSDIDLAAVGGDIFNFAADVDEMTNTLLQFDIVNLDEKISEDLQKEIERDGILIYAESPVMKKFDSFIKCLSVLLSASREESEKNEIYRMGLIGQFNLIFELSWKTLREVLLFHGVNDAATGSPREIIKLGYKFNFLSDEEVWLEMLKNRNLSAHIYNEEIDAQLAESIFEKYISAFVNLRDELKSRTE